MPQCITIHEAQAAIRTAALTAERLVERCLERIDRFEPRIQAWVVVDREGARQTARELDAELIAQRPERLRAYYRALEQLDGPCVQDAVNRMSPRPTERLGALIPLFCAERFLSDYAEDGKLSFRLNQVMRRVGLPLLPPTFRDVLPQARDMVRRRQAELLQRP